MLETLPSTTLGTSNRRLAIGMGMVSCSALIFQISTIRVLAASTWYHFTFLVVTLALLGSAVGAMSLALLEHRKHGTRSETGFPASCFALLSSALVFLTLVIHVQLPPEPFDIYLRGDMAQLGRIAVTIAPTFASFMALGITHALIFSRTLGNQRSLCASDLIGATIGCISSVILLPVLGAPYLYSLSAFLLATSALLLGVSKRWHVVIGSLSLLMLLVAIPPLVDSLETQFVFSDTKTIAGLESHIERTVWDPVARVDVLAPVQGIFPGAGGIGNNCMGNSYSYRLITQDGVAPTAIIQPTSSPSAMPILDCYLQGLVYRPYANASTLVIGVGGGLDVLLALHHGARSVVGVEINQTMCNLLESEYLEYSGALSLQPNVSLIHADGRSFIARCEKLFDVIVLNGTDTFSASVSGGYALAEDYLYTVEAFQDYIKHLASGGTLALSRWAMTPPREELRVVTTAIQALETLGAQRIPQHLMLVAGPQPQDGSFPWAQILIARDPFEEASVDAYRNWARFHRCDVIFDPYRPQSGIYDLVLHMTGEQRAQWITHYEYDVKPCTDSRPFFFQFYRWRSLWDAIEVWFAGLSDHSFSHPIRRTGRMAELPVGLFVLLVAMAGTLLLTLSTWSIPLLFRAQRSNLSHSMGGWGLLFLFSGIAFFLIEITVIQRLTLFLGTPAHAFLATFLYIVCSAGSGAIYENGRNRIQKPRMALLLIIIIALSCSIWILDKIWGRYMIYLPPLGRSITLGLALMPLGWAQGRAYACSMALVAREGRMHLYYALGVNFSASVFGTISATCMFPVLGVVDVMLLGVGCYVLELFVWRYFLSRVVHTCARIT